MNHHQVANVVTRAQFRRFFTCARRFWEDGRHSGVPVSRKRCYASAAKRHGISETVFDRLYSACFSEHRDRMAELSDRIDAHLEMRARH